jgi:hypothetical protein
LNLADLGWSDSQALAKSIKMITEERNSLLEGQDLLKMKIEMLEQELIYGQEQQK